MKRIFPKQSEQQETVQYVKRILRIKLMAELLALKNASTNQNQLYLEYKQ